MVYRDDVPEPVPGPGQVLVAVKACGICGSDLHFATHGEDMLAAGRQIEGIPDPGRDVDLSADIFMGHEFSAEVLEAGPGTDAPAVGTLVTSVPVVLSPTGLDMILNSNTTLGGYAERMILSAPLLLRVPNGLDPTHAALTEPMAVGLHAVNKSNVTPGEKTLVIGCGPIGIAIIAALKAKGVEDITAADFSARRRKLAAAVGAHAVLDPAEGSPFDSTSQFGKKGPAVVFEAVGAPGVIDDVLRRAPRGVRLVVAGVCMQPDTVHPLFAIAKEANLQFVFGYDPGEFATTLRSIAEGHVDVTPMVTAVVGLQDVGTAFGELSDPDQHCKIVVSPDL
jgi:2-desacetyl-2-hydroxyethyl bacteriochlorophyllide A dehydrogenase